MNTGISEERIRQVIRQGPSTSVRFSLRLQEGDGPELSAQKSEAKDPERKGQKVGSSLNQDTFHAFALLGQQKEIAPHELANTKNRH